VGRLGDDAEDVPRVGGRIDQRNGTTVAVPDQYGLFDPHLLHDMWKIFQRFLVEVVYLSFPPGWVGFAVTPALIDESLEVRRLAESEGEILPLADAAQAFVEKKQGG